MLVNRSLKRRRGTDYEPLDILEKDFTLLELFNSDDMEEVEKELLTWGLLNTLTRPHASPVFRLLDFLTTPTMSKNNCVVGQLNKGRERTLDPQEVLTNMKGWKIEIRRGVKNNGRGRIDKDPNVNFSLSSAELFQHPDVNLSSLGGELFQDPNVNISSSGGELLQDLNVNFSSPGGELFQGPHSSSGELFHHPNFNVSSSGGELFQDRNANLSSSGGESFQHSNVDIFSSVFECEENLPTLQITYGLNLNYHEAFSAGGSLGL
nr:hypothetical protein [Tanacetum cinerariifolium]